MRHDGSLNGLWIVRTSDPGTPGALLARVQEDLYALAFTNAPRAGAAARALGSEGKPFYVCRANIEGVVRELREAGARGFIVDYDTELARFASAHALPSSLAPDPR
jgi:hypothetical protein